MDVRSSNRVLLPGRIGNTNAVKVQAREERKGRTVQDLDDSCTTDDQEPTDQLYQSTSHNVLRNLQQSASRDNNALVLVDQVGLYVASKVWILGRCTAVVAVRRRQCLR